MFEDEPALIRCLPELNTLRIRGKLTDLSIDLQDNVALPVHKVILISRVPSLRDIVCEMPRERKAVLRWPKVPSEIARPLIDYIYTGQLKVCEASAAGLVVLSKQLSLTHVEEWAVSFIVARLNSENIANNWNFAQMLNSDRLMTACLQHIKTSFEATITSDFFIQLPSDTVLSLLRADDLQVGSEESVFEAIRLWVSPCGEIDEIRVVHAAAMMKEVRWDRINPEFRYKLLDNDGFWNRNVECLRLLGRIAGWFECPSSRAGRECPFNTNRRITQEEICLIGTSASSGQSVLIRYDANTKTSEQLNVLGDRSYAAFVAIEERTGLRLSSRITEHKRAVQRGDPLSEVATHILEEGYEFNFASTRIMTRASNKTGRKLLETWVSDTNAISGHVDIPACYHVLRSRGQEAGSNSQPSVHAAPSP
nr:unnamed protein product [Spirometra erinaceieuropaei]